MIAIACTSEATVPFDWHMLKELHDTCVKKNRQLGLTGFLSWKNDMFFQYLEGPENVVNEMLQEIQDDTWHTLKQTLQLGAVEQRRFSQWEVLTGSDASVPGVQIRSLVEDIINASEYAVFGEDESLRTIVKMMDQMSSLRRNNHKKALVNNTVGIDIGEKPPFVVVLGSSAGGLYPLQSIIRSLKPELDAAFIVIQHFSPNAETVMDQILQRDTSMNVCMAVRDMNVLAGRVYVIAPGENLEISNGKFQISKQQRENCCPQFPIDICFRSIAREYGDRAVAVILSGTGTDGSRGAKILKEAGGVVLAQTPESAAFDGMPVVSIESGIVHQILTPSEIAEFINNLSGDYVHDSLAMWPVRRAVYVSKVVSMLKNDHVDFSLHKSETLFRSIERRRVLAGISTSDDYAEFIRSSEKEREDLREDILITVSSFYRDPDAWVKLTESLTPLIISAWTQGETFRVWVTACSTGEEAYTIGIVLTELMEKLDKQVSFRIYATDIERKALKHASAGFYSERALTKVSPERRQRFFTRRAEGYMIISEIREKIIFSPHDLIRNAPFTRMHLVTCRNVLNHMQPENQQIAVKMLHLALKPEGILFLGPSETLGNLQSEFYPVQRKWNQYRKLGRLSSTLRPFLDGEGGSDRETPLKTASMSGNEPVNGHNEQDDQSGNAETQSLRRELEETKNALREALDDLESSDTRQRSINDQLAAANEELHRTNEELQAVNEELYSVNFEYQNRIHELSDLNQDLDNLLDITYSGVIFLDADLCIRRFTHVAAQTINLSPSDIGRPFVDLDHGMKDKDLVDDIRRVLSMGRTTTRDISGGKVNLRRVGIHPYLASSGVAQGVILMFHHVRKSSSPAQVLEDLDTSH